MSLNVTYRSNQLRLNYEHPSMEPKKGVEVPVGRESRFKLKLDAKDTHKHLIDNITLPSKLNRLLRRGKVDKGTAIRTTKVWILTDDGSFKVKKNKLARHLGVKPEDLNKHLLRSPKTDIIVVDPKYIKSSLKKVYATAQRIEKLTNALEEDMNNLGEDTSRSQEKKLEKRIKKREKLLKSEMRKDPFMPIKDIKKYFKEYNDFEFDSDDEDYEEKDLIKDIKATFWWRAKGKSEES